MRLIVLALLLCGCTTNDYFRSDGSGRDATWTYSVRLSNYPNEDAGEIAESFLKKKKLCGAGWQTISKRQTDDRLTVRGRCL